MIHQTLLDDIRRERRRGQFLYPLYGKVSIAEVVPTIEGLFSLSVERATLPPAFTSNVQAQKIILNIIDGFAYVDFVRHGRDTVLFDRLLERGHVYPITSVFPSTTPAALTTLHTGLTPQEHGLPEWFTYFPEFEEVIMPMEFRARWTDPRDFLLEQGGTADMVYAGKTIHDRLAAHHIPTYVFVYHEYYPSVYSNVVFHGAEIITYHEGFELMQKLRQLLQQPGPAYCVVHWGQVDRTAHRFGPGSPEHVNTIRAYADLVNIALLQKLDRTMAEDVALLVTADHGQIGIKHEDIIFLNDYPIALTFLETTSQGQPILPCGSPNDVFLHIKPQKLREALSFLRAELAEAAEVLTIDDAIAQGLFGLNSPSQRFLDRIGNVALLPYPGQHIWYTEISQDRYGQLGMHGGLSEEEMLVPFAVARLSDLL